MKHLKEAKAAMPKEVKKYIKVTKNAVAFTVQDGPIKEVGVNGLQAQDMLEFNKELFISLNNEFSCIENTQTIMLVERGINYQKRRTADREKREVEGTNEA